MERILIFLILLAAYGKLGAEECSMEDVDSYLKFGEAVRCKVKQMAVKIDTKKDVFTLTKYFNSDALPICRNPMNYPVLTAEWFFCWGEQFGYNTAGVIQHVVAILINEEIGVDIMPLFTSTSAIAAHTNESQTCPASVCTCIIPSCPDCKFPDYKCPDCTCPECKACPDCNCKACPDCKCEMSNCHC